jgi:hypothetical protein
MMPRKRDDVSTIVFFGSLSVYETPHGEERVFARLEPWGMNGLILRDATKTSLLGMRDVMLLKRR